GQQLRAFRKIAQQLVAVVVEIADQRHDDAHLVQLLADHRNGGGGFRRIDRDTHHFRTGARQFLDLDRRADRIRRIGVRHRLHDDRRVAADTDFALAGTHDRGAAATAGQWAGSDLLLLGHDYFTFRRATLLLLPDISSGLPRSVTLTPAALPMTIDDGAVISKASVVPALNRRDTRILSSARRISTQ